MLAISSLLTPVMLASLLRPQCTCFCLRALTRAIFSTQSIPVLVIYRPHASRCLLRCPRRDYVSTDWQHWLPHASGLKSPAYIFISPPFRLDTSCLSSAGHMALSTAWNACLGCPGTREYVHWCEWTARFTLESVPESVRTDPFLLRSSNGLSFLWASRLSEDRCNRFAVFQRMAWVIWLKIMRRTNCTGFSKFLEKKIPFRPTSSYRPFYPGHLGPLVPEEASSHATLSRVRAVEPTMKLIEHRWP